MIKVLGIVPARAGSKGIKKKNIFPILGKPLISYTLEAAKESKLLSDIVITSDELEIQAIAKDYGINFNIRPVELAEDTTPIADVINFQLQNYSSNFDAIMLLQPTAPIREGSDIDNTILLLNDNQNANSVISVCEMNEIHPARMYNLSKRYLKTLDKKYEKTRSQNCILYIYINQKDAFRC